MAEPSDVFTPTPRHERRPRSHQSPASATTDASSKQPHISQVTAGLSGVGGMSEDDIKRAQQQLAIGLARSCFIIWRNRRRNAEESGNSTEDNDALMCSPPPFGDLRLIGDTIYILTGSHRVDVRGRNLGRLISALAVRAIDEIAPGAAEIPGGEGTWCIDTISIQPADSGFR